jgi:hypothetical protein
MQNRQQAEKKSANIFDIGLAFTHKKASADLKREVCVSPLRVCRLVMDLAVCLSRASSGADWLYLGLFLMVEPASQAIAFAFLQYLDKRADAQLARRKELLAEFMARKEALKQESAKYERALF